MRKVAIKALNPEHGKEVIKYLESIGGKNDYRRKGSAINQYYFINERGYIFNNPTLPENYTLIELPKENKNNKTMYKSFAITGSQPLLKAMEETLNKEGFKSDCQYSLLKGYIKADKLCSSKAKNETKESFLDICAVSVSVDEKLFTTFNLPEQWNEALDFILGQLKPKIEVGSWVIGHKGFYPIHAVKVLSIKGETIKYNIKDPDSEEPSNSNILKYVRLATPEEIEAAQTVKIGSYKAEKVDNTIKFGCQSFTKEELQAYKKLLNNNINAKIEIAGTIITKDILDRLINKL